LLLKSDVGGNFFRVLSMMLYRPITSKGIGALAKLEHLQQFLYRDKYDLEESRYFRLCLKLLPKLGVSHF
jgi:hypothetical protein